MKQRQLLLLALLLTAYCSSYAQDFAGVSYGPEARQFLDIYIAPSATPTPVYFDAHPNGGNTNMPSSIIDDLKAIGVSTVAWESLTSVNTPSEVETGWDDAELMLAWVKENAGTYNFDTTCLIIGGSSRGSILSWKIGHMGNPNVKGLYMYNALPDGVWADPSWWYAPDEVTADSPPIFFVYRFEPGTNDIHDPENGMIIMDTYDALGIGDRDTLIHSISATGNPDRYQFLVEFIQEVGCAGAPVDVEIIADQTPTWRAFPNPFYDQLNIADLQGDEYFRVTSLLGGLVRESDTWEALDMAALSPGAYFLTIQSKQRKQVLKLIKQ